MGTEKCQARYYSLELAQTHLKENNRSSAVECLGASGNCASCLDAGLCVNVAMAILKYLRPDPSRQMSAW
jgi:hypothetical protein